ncbi:hypothetical protein LAZ67_8000167 [Cordylochernes scorpioides]|uniref:Uncharacterized protein n=1 Tax=Cordylochernes scorpioides TaxID=51811 RepID=A0ABY6KR41_9ARAC|nr:hypothetical protein LAZ67_8000167 [Cordylochernes scorpioides]
MRECLKEFFSLQTQLLGTSDDFRRLFVLQENVQLNPRHVAPYRAIQMRGESYGAVSGGETAMTRDYGAVSGGETAVTRDYGAVSGGETAVARDCEETAAVCCDEDGAVSGGETAVTRDCEETAVTRDCSSTVDRRRLCAVMKTGLYQVGRQLRPETARRRLRGCIRRGDGYGAVSGGEAAVTRDCEETAVTRDCEETATELYQAGRQLRSCIRRGGSCDHRPNDCCYNSSCRCNLWGTNCRCQRMGLFQKWGK